MSRMGREEWVRRRGVTVVAATGSGTGVDKASRKDWKEEMTTAGVGRGEARAEKGGGVEDEEGEGESEDGGDWAAETSTSRGEEEGVGATRVRPSSDLLSWV
jgi:hypothetical protein